jgi:hypothetical protein
MDYALYKGDTFIDLGSKKRLAERIGVSVSTITFYGTPTYIKRGKREDSNRYLVIKIRSDEE